MKATNQQNPPPQNTNPTTLTRQQTIPQAKPVYKYGGMTVPSKLILYEKSYMFAMVPLAQKLQARNIFFLLTHR